MKALPTFVTFFASEIIFLNFGYKELSVRPLARGGTTNVCDLMSS